MATSNGGAFQLAQRESSIQADRTVMINVRYTTSAGTEVATKTILMPSDGPLTRTMGGPVLDSPAPQSLIDATNTYIAELDSYIATLAAAGKLDI